MKMKFLLNFLFIILMCNSNLAQMPPKVSARTHVSRTNQEYNEILINTDRFISSLDHKLTNIIKNEMNSIRHELRNDHSAVLNSMKTTIDKIHTQCLQDQIFGTSSITSNNNNNNNSSFNKLDNLQQLIVSLRGSTNRIEKDLAIIKKRTINGKSYHPMTLPRNDFYHDHEHACISADIAESGIKKIRKDFFVHCEVIAADDDNAGNWIAIQNRNDGNINFFKSWSEYKEGFGNIAGDFFLGLDKIHELTSAKPHELLILMEDVNEEKLTAKYSTFGISSEATGYALNMLGKYSGTAGDALSYHAGMKFSTFDVDNDEWTDGSCAKSHLAGWWYNKCSMGNLNGVFANAQPLPNEMQIIHWKRDKSSTAILKSVKMLIRPVD